MILFLKGKFFMVFFKCLKVATVFFAVLGFSTLSVEAAKKAVVKNVGVKIGTVDMQYVLQTVEAGKKAKKSLEKTFKKRKKNLQKQEAKIKKLHEEFQKKSLVMSEKARAQKQGEIQQKIMQLQQETAKSQQELAKKEATLKNPIIRRIKNLINKIAQERGYTVVLERNDNNVLFSLDKDNLTKEIIKKFNKTHGSKLIAS